MKTTPYILWKLLHRFQPRFAQQ